MYSFTFFEIKGGNNMERMVVIKNMVNSQVGIRDLTTNMLRKWNKKGHTIAIPFSTVEQLMWQNGFKNMIETGILYIENMQDKIDLGIEPYDAKTPVNIIVLNDKQIEELMTTTPIDVFKCEMKKLSKVQVDNLIEYAIEHQLVDSAKCSFLKLMTGKDIFKAISQKEEDKMLLEREKQYQERLRVEGRR